MRTGKDVILKYCENVKTEDKEHLENCKKVRKLILEGSKNKDFGDCPNAFGLNNFDAKCDKEEVENEDPIKQCIDCWESALKLEISINPLEGELENRINDLKNEIKKVETTKELIEKYPDLTELKFNDNIYLVSEKANRIAYNVEFQKGSDYSVNSPLFILFFYSEKDIKIYTNPLYIRIGHKCEGGSGFIPDENWREELTKYNIDKKLYVFIEQYFKNNSPVIDTENI